MDVCGHKHSLSDVHNTDRETSVELGPILREQCSTEVTIGPFDPEEQTTISNTTSHLNLRKNNTQLLISYAKQRKTMTYVHVVSDINPSCCYITDNKMGSVTDKLPKDDLSHGRVKMDNISCNGLVNESRHQDILLCDRVNSYGLSPDLVTSNRVKCDRSYSIISTRFWAGTPWNGFTAFKGDLFSKCTQFFHTYIWRGSKGN